MLKNNKLSVMICSLVSIFLFGCNISTPPEGKIDNRFSVSNGVIIDSKTKLEWLPNAKVIMRFKQAKSYADALKVGGHQNWHLPTHNELSDLHDSSRKSRQKIWNIFHVGGILNLGGGMVWTSDKGVKGVYVLSENLVDIFPIFNFLGHINVLVVRNPDGDR